jgi:hypothetical protein
MYKFLPVNKFGATRTNGYSSKREAAYAANLAEMKANGEVLDWLEQVPVRLPGSTRYVIDFEVFMADGSVKFVEVKGVQTESWRIKMRLLEEAKPWVFARLEVVK